MLDFFRFLTPVKDASRLKTKVIVQLEGVLADFNSIRMSRSTPI
jgi:hypothetical protein